MQGFEKQATLSLIFHSQIASSYQNPTLEHDVSQPALKDSYLDYVPSKLLGKNVLDAGEFEPSDVKKKLELALTRHSEKAHIRVKKWRDQTFNKMYQAASNLPRMLNLTNRRLDLLEPNYPHEILKLSIFVLSDLTDNPSLAKKYAILHHSGMRHVGDLVLFHPRVKWIFRCLV